MNNPLYPAEALEYGPFEIDGMYYSMSIGHGLRDVSGQSYIEVDTGQGREADELAARHVIAALQLTAGMSLENLEAAVKAMDSPAPAMKKERTMKTITVEVTPDVLQRAGQFSPINLAVRPLVDLNKCSVSWRDIPEIQHRKKLGGETYQIAVPERISDWLDKWLSGCSVLPVSFDVTLPDWVPLAEPAKP